MKNLLKTKPGYKDLIFFVASVKIYLPLYSQVVKKLLLKLVLISTDAIKNSSFQTS